ncbi:hypothetical protein ACQEVB_31925 [Pseudonocardia sp. CA-107938]|uniref:hypothetical protein n=1 Tax=Pseudonocardia sp. CA-107938 TaxID=3240021 RepID=UPI003D8BBB5A
MTHPSFYAARNHLGIELGAEATAAQVRTVASRGFDFAVLPGDAAARIGPQVSGIGLVVRDPTPPATEPRFGWEPDRLQPADLPLFHHLGPDDPVGPAALADAVRVSAPDLAVAGAVRERVRAAVAAAGRDPDGVPVLADLDVHVTDRGRPGPPGLLQVSGSVADIARVVEAAVRLRAADGVTLRPVDPDADLRRIGAELVPLLAGRGLFRPGHGGSLRERLALGTRSVTFVSRESA